MYGKIVHKFCLPAHIASDIIKRLHAVHGLHYAPDQMLRIFSLNFHATDQDKLISKISKSYKKKSAGSRRTFDEELKPGNTVVADVLYLPRDSQDYKFIMLFVDRLTSYAMAVPLKNLDAKTTSGALNQFLSFLPAPQVLMVDGDGSFIAAFEET